MLVQKKDEKSYRCRDAVIAFRYFFNLVKTKIQPLLEMPVLEILNSLKIILKIMIKKQCFAHMTE